MGKGTNFTGTINIVENAEGGTAWTQCSNHSRRGGDMDVDWKRQNYIFNEQRTINLNGYTITLADGTVLK